MKIAQIAPLAERVPPKKYGGTERVVFTLTEELVKRGHKVTLFASCDSITTANLQPIYPRSLREGRINNPYGPNIINMTNIGQAYSMHDKFDIIHDHNGYLGLPTANISKTPVVMTLHGSISPYEKKAFEIMRKPYLVSISNAQRKPAPDLNYIDTVHNGLNLENLPFSEEHQGYLLFVGRLTMEKGVHFAIEAAHNLNLNLKIAAKLDSVDMGYFNEYIGPKLSEEQVQWVGEVDETERNKLMSEALCLLHPVTWREPFGLAMIEAMACGCPVVAFNKGSIPEIVKNKKNGYVVNDLEEMIEAVKSINNINRKYCRKYAIKNFNGKAMTDKYEAVYNKLLKAKAR
jgi:glycosyltransferase involved in cell wall biosynthesis